MELDKRIKSLTDIQSVTNGCHDWELMNKKGYFADRIFDFKDLKRTCMYGEYAEYREHDQCFLCKIDHHDGTFDDTYYRYFIPEDVLEPVEKKYRALTLNEFLERFKIGEALYIRFKRDKAERVVVFVEYSTPPHKDEGNDTESVCLTGIEHHNSVVCLGMREYYLATLFDCYEYFDGKEWQPFGVIDE